MLSTRESSNASQLSYSWYVWLKYWLPFLFFPILSHNQDQSILLAQPEGLSATQREAGLYALVHHTEAETATQGDGVFEKNRHTTFMESNMGLDKS